MDLASPAVSGTSVYANGLSEDRSFPAFFLLSAAVILSITCFKRWPRGSTFNTFCYMNNWKCQWALQ